MSSNNNWEQRMNAEGARTHPVTGLPDLNEIPTEEAFVLPQVEPTQLRTIMRLFLKFSTRVPMPSRDYLMSMFSSFGPLDSSETKVYEEFRGAVVAFVCSGDAEEAAKSVQNANPFGEALVSMGLQPKVMTAPGTGPPVISEFYPVPKLNTTPTCVESMKMELLKMAVMMDQSGDRVPREMKEKIKSDIATLLQIISSMLSSSPSFSS